MDKGEEGCAGPTRGDSPGKRRRQRFLTDIRVWPNGHMLNQEQDPHVIMTQKHRLVPNLYDTLRHS